jgi:purine-binding chemotaxis protein CheW
MSEIKNPLESLFNYFDELLAVGEQAEASVEQLSVFPQEVLSVSNAVTAAPLPVQKPQQKIAPTAPTFADPTLVQKEKLQKLLHSAQPSMAIAPLVKIEVAPVTTLVTKGYVVNPHEIQEWAIETSAPIAVETEVALAAITPAKLTQTNTLPESFQMAGLAWLPNGLPQWAQAPFDVLLFKVSGLTLAVPLVALGQIQPITDELTPLFGQADWFMGLQPTPSGQIRTVNTAKFVMPERYDESFAKNAKYVVSINSVPWGLAVDSVNQPIRLAPDAVQWRTNRSKRPWLAGMIKAHMCALLDIPMIGQLLMDADKNFLNSRLQ